MLRARCRPLIFWIESIAERARKGTCFSGLVFGICTKHVRKTQVYPPKSCLFVLALNFSIVSCQPFWSRSFVFVRSSFGIVWDTPAMRVVAIDMKNVVIGKHNVQQRSTSGTDNNCRRHWAFWL